MLFRRSASSAAKPAPDPSPRAVPEGCRLYAIGDVHGRIDCLEEMLGLIATDLADATPAPREAIVVFLGDYVDRGPDSAAVLERLTQPLPFAARARFLKGNHEDGMLTFLDEPRRGRAWIGWGRETLESYGIGVPEAGAEADVLTVRDALAAALPPHHLRFLRELDVSTQLGDYFFAHAGIDPDLPLGLQPDRALMWIRDKFLKSEKEYGRVIVHGHTVGEMPIECANRIGIDTGAYATGVLTALVLEGETRRFLFARCGEAR